MKINFKMVDRNNPIVSIKGYMDVYDGSKYAMNFYDSFNNICVRIPENPFVYYTNDYYDYVDLVYSFECDEEFIPILNKFVECEHQNIIIQRPHYDLVLERGDLNE